jgi:hypothetical protein
MRVISLAHKSPAPFWGTVFFGPGAYPMLTQSTRGAPETSDGGAAVLLSSVLESIVWVRRRVLMTLI